MQLKRVEGGSTYGGRNVETAVENGKSLFSIIEDKYRDSNKVECDSFCVDER